MKQTFLTFGHNTPKKSGRTPECSGNHPSLSSIRNCKKCYTIAALRKRCANTTSLTTGQTVGTWGTKEQVLERLINNARPNQRNKMSEGMSAHSNLLQSCFVCIIIWLFHIFKLTLHLLFSLFLLYLSFSICLDSVGTQPQEHVASQHGGEKSPWGFALDEQGYPVIALTISLCKNGWVAKGRLKLSKNKRHNFRYPHHRKAGHYVVSHVLLSFIIIMYCLFVLFFMCATFCCVTGI